MTMTTTTGPARRGPSVAWYPIGGVLFLGALAAAIVVLAVGLVHVFDTVDQFERIAAPGAADITIGRPGTYIIYYEYKSKLNGRTIDAPRDPPRAQVVLTGPDGQPVGLRTFTSVETYDVGDHAGEAEQKFDATTPGTYHLDVRVPGEPAGNRFVVAVGRGGIGKLFAAPIVGFFGLLGLGLVVGGLLVVFTAVGRHRARLDARPPTSAPGPGPGNIPGPAWAPPLR